MANRLYPKGAQKLLDGLINLSTAQIKAVLISDGYTFSVAHEFQSDLVTVGTPVALANKVTAGGVFDADDVAFGAVAAGSTVKGLALFVDTGNPSTSALLAFYDLITGFPFATNGGSVSVPWSDGAAKIISLV